MAGSLNMHLGEWLFFLPFHIIPVHAGGIGVVGDLFHFKAVPLKKGIGVLGGIQLYSGFRKKEADLFESVAEERAANILLVKIVVHQAPGQGGFVGGWVVTKTSTADHLLVLQHHIISVFLPGIEVDIAFEVIKPFPELADLLKGKIFGGV